jgi:hypothetical protein
MNVCTRLQFRLYINAEFFFQHQEHTGRVFRLQFDEFQIVSSSHDDTIIIWDFLNEQPMKLDDNNGSNTSSSSNNSNQGHVNPVHMPWLPTGANNLNLLNNRNQPGLLQSPGTSPLSQRRNLRLVNNNQNSPPSPMEGDD